MQSKCNWKYKIFFFTEFYKVVMKRKSFVDIKGKKDTYERFLFFYLLFEDGFLARDNP